jgi:UDP-N-acetylmuramoylalanine--D-glutamate ligase
VRIAIIGYGLQGQSAYGYWRKPENHITICDKNEALDLPAGVQAQLGEDYLKHLDQFDLIVRSPSVHPHDIITANTPDITAKVSTVTNEFLRVSPTKNIIGITGTKGKGTTSTLVARMLQAAGKTVYIGGNIGTPPLDLLKEDIQADDWVVLELANFQLIDLRYSPPLAACLMVAPEHLNWHSDMEEYIQAKAQLFAHQTPQDTAIYFADNEISHQIASTSPGAKIAYYAEPGAYVQDDAIVIDNQQICKVHDLKLLGKHNWQNACAAATIVWQVVRDIPAIKSTLTTFSGLEHRLELVRTIDDVDYYDDSFGTTPETAMVAVEAFDRPKVLILGGSDKGATYDELAKTVAENNVRQVITIGETGPAIAEALRSAGFENITPGGITMEDIVSVARNAAKSGDVVLLSTGCASFGLFDNYKDRGNKFHVAVGAL